MKATKTERVVTLADIAKFVDARGTFAIVNVERAIPSRLHIINPFEIGDSYPARNTEVDAMLHPIHALLIKPARVKSGEPSEKGQAWGVFYRIGPTIHSGEQTVPIRDAPLKVRVYFALNYGQIMDEWQEEVERVVAMMQGLREV